MSLLNPVERSKYTDIVLAQLRDVPDFPAPGILFRDISPVLQSPEGLRAVAALMFDTVWAVTSSEVHDLDLVAGVESRGFILGSVLARDLGCGFTMIRKPGKLPCPTVSERYGKEYGRDVVHMHTDGVQPGQRVVLVDDLIATGGSLLAAARLIRRLGGEIVTCLCLIELKELGGRAKLEAEGVRVDSIVRF